MIQTYEADDDNFCRHCRKHLNKHDFGLDGKDYCWPLTAYEQCFTCHQVRNGAGILTHREWCSWKPVVVKEPSVSWDDVKAKLRGENVEDILKCAIGVKGYNAGLGNSMPSGIAIYIDDLFVNHANNLKNGRALDKLIDSLRTWPSPHIEVEKVEALIEQFKKQ